VFHCVGTDNARSVTVYRNLSRHLLLPGLDVLRHTHAASCLGELEESQWWPRERLDTVQSERLQRLIRHAYGRVPHYRRLMERLGTTPASIRTAADLPSLPVLTRDDVREHGEELLASGFPPRDLLHGRTSGSTGEPLSFYSSREERWSRGVARSLRALEWAGAYPGDTVLHIVERGHFVSSPPFRSLTRILSRESYEDPSDFTESSLPAVVARIAKLRPRALRGYASAVCIIAEYVRQSGVPAPQVGAIVTGGEQLFEGQRALLREVFGREPFSKYSAFENYDIAMECSAHSGLHVAAEDLIVEVVDDDGRPLEPGQVGHILVTNLHEYGMPRIRYDTSDEGSFVEGSCSCGRVHPRLSTVIGRTGGAIYTPSGKRLSTVSLDSSGLVPLGIRQFQLVQDELDHVTVRVVPGAAASGTEAAALGEAVRAQFCDWLGGDVQLDVAIVERIVPTPAGKHLYLVSNVPLPAAESPFRERRD